MDTHSARNRGREEAEDLSLRKDWPTGAIPILSYTMHKWDCHMTMALAAEFCLFLERIRGGKPCHENKK